MQTIYFDLDGTIYPLYDQPDWLARITSQPETDIFCQDVMSYPVQEFQSVIENLVRKGYRIGVISWTPADASADYVKAVRAAKRAWIKKYLPQASEIHIVKYGTPKHRVAKSFGILVDDVTEVRDAWTKGATINAKMNILPLLANI